MKVALDTSVLIAALWAQHPAHGRAAPWLLDAGSDEHERTVCAHALAETWSVLTRMPVSPRIPVSSAAAAVDRIAAAVCVESVDAPLQRAAIQRCVERGLAGGVLHDALQLLAAERAGVDALVTLNARDFERLRSTDSPRVLVP